MKKLFKTLLLLIILSAVAAAVVAYISRKRLEDMSDEEIRTYLQEKLGDKVNEEQLVAIQDSVIAGIRRTNKAMDSAESALSDAKDAAAEITDDATDAAAEIAGDATDAVEDVVDDLTDDE